MDRDFEPDEYERAMAPRRRHRDRVRRATQVVLGKLIHGERGKQGILGELHHYYWAIAEFGADSESARIGEGRIRKKAERVGRKLMQAARVGRRSDISHGFIEGCDVAFSLLYVLLAADGKPVAIGGGYLSGDSFGSLPFGAIGTINLWQALPWLIMIWDREPWQPTEIGTPRILFAPSTPG